MTAAQERALREILASHGQVILHHGDCVGADAQAHDIAVELGRAIIIHPPIGGARARRAWKAAPDVREAKPYLKRNKDIVRETELLIATPAEASEQQRSGTWSTVRFARTQGREIWLIQPDGVIRELGGQTGGAGMSDVTRSHEHDAKLTAFIVESNHIEGIHRPPTPEEVKAHKALLARETVKIEHVTALVARVSPTQCFAPLPTSMACAWAITSPRRAGRRSSRSSICC
jgi:hypothetical protein